jgi:predicted  nucleic acid-binding Zn-ribbon protein
MDDLSPIKKSKPASHRTDSLRLDETRQVDEESSTMMASMATTIKDLERSNAELHEMLLKKSQADDDGAGQQQQQVILKDEVKEAHLQHIASLQRQVKELEGRLGELDAARSLAVEDRSRTEAGLKIEKAGVERMQREIERLELRIASGEERERAIEAGRREEQEGYMREMGRKLSEQQVEFNKVVDRHNEEVALLKQQLIEEKTRSLEAAAAVPKVDRKSIEGKQEEVTALQRVCLRLKSENAGLAQKIKGTEGELGRAREEIVSLESRLKLLGESHREKGALLEKGRASDEAKRSLEMQLAQAVEEVRSLKKAGSDDGAEIGRMKDRIAELEGLLAAERAALAESMMAAQPVVADKDDKKSGTTPRVLVERGSNATTPRAVVERKDGSGEVEARLKGRISELEETEGRMKDRIAELEETEGRMKRRISELEETEGRMKGRIAELEDLVKRGSAKSSRAFVDGRQEIVPSSAALGGIAEAMTRLEGEATSLKQIAETVWRGKTRGQYLEERRQPQTDPVCAPSPRRIRLSQPRLVQMDSNVYSTKTRIFHNVYHEAERDLDEGVLRRRGNAARSTAYSSVLVPNTSLDVGSDAALDHGVLKRHGKSTTNTIYSSILAPYGNYASPVYSPECFSFGKSIHYDVGNRTSAIFLVKARPSPRTTPRATHTPRSVGTPRVLGFECQYCHHDRRIGNCRHCMPGLNINAEGENLEVRDIISTLSGSGKELTAMSYGREQDQSARSLAM